MHVAVDTTDVHTPTTSSGDLAKVIVNNLCTCTYLSTLADLYFTIIRNHTHTHTHTHTHMNMYDPLQSVAMYQA